MQVRTISLSAEQISALQSAGTKYGFGGALVVVGGLWSVSGLFAIGALASDDNSVSPAVAYTGVGLAVTIIGALLLSSASTELDRIGD